MTAANTPRVAALPTGLRVLVVEDEMLIAMLFEEFLRRLGCRIIGPIGRVAKAIPLAKLEPLDAAILDVNVAREEVFPVACELARRAIPFLFVSGYGADRLPKEWCKRPLLQKPFNSEALERSMSMAFATARRNSTEGPP
ncbi:MAG: response regulator [Alphaproteobacteria bacterium]|nr:response regulator [Alphaproteobacteria bacterium]